MLNARWRRNPFDANTVNSLLITEEEHTIEYHPEPNAYGFYANEGILLDANDPVVLVQDNTAQTAFAEIPRTIAPSSGQFRVDYDEDGYYNTGFVQCNSSDNGKTVLFTYRGTGTLVHPTFRVLTDYNYAGNVNVEGNATIAGDVVLADSTGSTISASGKKIEDVGDPTAATDAVTLGYFENNNSHFAFFTANGSFTVPAGVTEILAEIAGGGGGGGGGVSGYGGGGGGQSCDIAKYAVTPGEVISITIGSGGAGGVANTSAGSAGGNTVFGTYKTQAGGGGGALGGTSGRGGAGAGNAAQSGGSTPSTGSFEAAGTGGGAGGAGGVGSGGNKNGETGRLGGGGGGGSNNTADGGAGGGGYVKIWW